MGTVIIDCKTKLYATLVACLCHVLYLLLLEDMTSHPVHENIASS